MLIDSYDRLRPQLRLYVSACFYYTGLVPLARWWAQRSQPHLTILYYHQASKANLRSHWQYVRRHYHVLPLETALAELHMPPEKAVQRRDQRPLLALTFDDGYYDNYTHAFPLACELQLPMTIFLIPGHMESGKSFWWANRLIRHARAEQVTFEERAYHLGDLEECKALAQAIDARYTQFTLPGEQAKFVASLYMLLDVPSSVVLKEEPAPLLTWEQVREMEDSGWVSFGAHTMHHPDLGSLVDHEEIEREVGECRPVLEQHLGHPVHSFAYPFGSTGEYGPHAVERAGYDWAVTVKPGVNTCQSDPHLLKRRNMDGAKHWLVMAAETAGIWGFFSQLKSVTRKYL
jgi:peptidoglycan/xylan/chitin deacetylase (PgdA/CDA1 family)